MSHAIMLFDAEGYYATELAGSEAEVKKRVAARSARAPSLLFASLPYEVATIDGVAPDVTLPADFKTELEPARNHCHQCGHEWRGNPNWIDCPHCGSPDAP